MPPKRPKGVTFKLVHQPYEDPDSQNGTRAVMVEESVLRQNLPGVEARRVAHKPRAKRGDENGVVSISDLAREWASRGESDDDACLSDMDVRNSGEGEVGSDSDGELFDDQEETEVTDDFLRELVYGGDGDVVCNSDHLANTEVVGTVAEVVMPRHDTVKRAIDRQFTQIMREFNVDALLNDAGIDDPRTHGPLEVNQYFRALEEFVVDRAGIDYTTAEPLRNKGLIHKLKSLASEACTDMSSSGEVYGTTVLPDRKARFVADYQRETEAIRQAAVERLKKRQDVSEPDEEEAVVKLNGMEKQREEVEVYVTRNIGDRTNRLDCETAVSVYSTYFNQPNVIRAPEAGKKQKARKGVVQSSTSSAVPECVEMRDEGDGDGGPIPRELVVPKRVDDESREEKRLRKKLVKELQRERRIKKRELRDAYKAIEADEAKRAKESQTAKRTMHFL
uniref:Uncharacterized protein n=1 Tax=Trypanosoma vivax (strain Y486) TaxID=1055687 RepID=G0TT65_TRYVY|nr:conserved hypothetical protein [Trypanosoma vivax Y486]